MVRIAPNGDRAVLADRRDDPAADAAIGAGGFRLNGHGSFLPARSYAPHPPAGTFSPQAGRRRMWRCRCSSTLLPVGTGRRWRQPDEGLGWLLSSITPLRS